MIRPFGVSIPANILGLVLFETVVIVAAFVFSVNLYAETYPTEFLDSFVGVNVVLAYLGFFVGLYFQDLYQDVQVKSVVLLAQQLVMVVGIVLLLQSVVITIYPDLYMPLRVMLVGSAISVSVLFFGRLIFSAYVLPLVASERLLLYGQNPVLDDIAGYVQKFPQLGIQVAGHVHTVQPEPELGLVGQLDSLIQSYRTKRLVVGMSGKMDSALASALLELQSLGYSVQEAARTYSKICNRENLFRLGPKRLLYTKEFEPQTRTLFFQGLFSWVIAAVFCIALSPLIVVIMIAARLCWGGPVLQRQTYSGRYGNSFRLYCFRGFDSILNPEKDSRGEAPGATRDYLGSFLLRTGLYALPQLFNVLRGEMSLVGPKPQRPEFFTQLTEQIPFYPHRLKVLPGITGWSQVQTRRLSGRVECLVELEYDLYYLKYCSLRMDIFVILQAIKNVMLWGGRPSNVLSD